MDNKIWQSWDIRLIAVLASLFLSIYTFFLQSTPNDDAYIYIRTAEIFSTDGAAAAFAHYSWATYPILISFTAGVMNVGLFTAAHILNAFFYALLVYSFISIVREIDTSPRLLLLSAITVLLYPQLNEFRQEIIRDTGFWSLSIFALWQFMCFSRTRLPRYIFVYCTTMILAATFRAEALVYMVVIPVSMLFDHSFNSKQKMHYSLLYGGIGAGVLLLALLIFALSGLNLIGLFRDFVAVYFPFISNTIFPTEQESLELGRAIFNDFATYYSSEYLGLFLVTGLTAVLLANMINGIGAPYLLVLATGIFKNVFAIPRKNALPLIAVMVTNGFILLIFIMVTRFLASRYTMMFCIMLSFFVPIILERLLARSEIRDRKSLAVGILAFFLTYCALDAYVNFGDSKQYLYDAASWISENSPENGQLVTNNFAIAYYSGMVEDFDRTQRNLTRSEILDLEPGSLIAIESTIEMDSLLLEAEIREVIDLVRSYSDDDDTRLVIYRRNTN